MRLEGECKDKFIKDLLNSKYLKYSQSSERELEEVNEEMKED
jgi:hypothetical protein